MVLGKLFGVDDRKAAIRSYVLLLPAQIEDDWGLRREYKPEQILASAKRAKLPLEHIIIGYGMFLTRANFNAINVTGESYDRLMVETGFLQRSRD